MRLEIDTSTDSVLDRSGPEWQVYQDSQERFGGDELIVVAITGETPFDPDTLVRISTLSDALVTLEGVRRVDSLDTVPVIRVDAAGDLVLDPALEGAPSAGPQRGQHVARLVAHDRIAPRSLMSEDGRTFAINLVLERGAESRHRELLAELHEIIDPAGGVLSGVPVFRVAANDRTGTEILLFAPLTAGIIALILMMIFRTPSVIVLGTLPGIIGSWILLACMGWLGAPLSITTMVLPSIILALGCAYAMHLLAAASDASLQAGGRPERDALERALGTVTLPVALSGLTTVVGFVSITLVRIDAVRSTGGFGALGVLIVTAVSLTLLPATLQLAPLPPSAPRGFERIRRGLGPWLVSLVLRRRAAVLAVWAGLAIASLAGLTQVRVETDATRWLPPGHPVRDSYETIRERLSGISPINIVIDAPSGASVLEPEVLAALDGLGAYLESLPEVGKALSIADPLRQLNGSFQDDPGQPLPATRAMASQYLVLLESVEPIHDLISSDRSAANILLRADDNGSESLMQVGEAATHWWRAHGVADHTLTTTGIMHEFARAEDAIAYGQLRGLSFALAMISVVLFAIFRWPRLAAVALIPNALPLLLIFGAMGLLGVPLDAGTVLIGSLALGVAVDDTIHITTSYAHQVRAGRSPAEALAETYSAVLPAIVSTTVLITASFLVLGLSEFTITRNLGLVTAGIMVLCLVADVSLLGALLIRLHRRPTGADERAISP
jgi:predicted RND superfamily exporter protein